ncbi:MAG: DUF87 domain-containing protein [Chloroflexi bacterium]|nr:DUF87 domain-containing protein [Chloroflexota bacterium]
MAIETPLELLLPVLGQVLPAFLGAAALVAALLLGPRLVRCLRQAAYERTLEAETVRLELLVPAGREPDPDAAIELIRALHPRHRRGVGGFGGFAVGWPSVELRLLWREGLLRWQIDCPRQLEPAVSVALGAACPGIDLEEVPPDDRPATASAGASLVASEAWALHAVGSLDGRAVPRLARLLAALSWPVEVRLSLYLRALPPEAWRRVVEPETSGPSVAALVGTAIVDALLSRTSADHEPSERRVSAAEREALKRKRQGVVGFATRATLEVAGADVSIAKAVLWRLVSFSDVLGDGRQGIAWRVTGRPATGGSAMHFADWEVAQLWSLPDEAVDRTGVRRRRPLSGSAPPAPATDSARLVIGHGARGPVALSTDSLARHLAVFGATGSGKSTLLLTLVDELMRSPLGGTVIDPHGDLADDILSRVPPSARDRVHVLRLADRDHPRGFNFLERRSPDEAQLVTSEFVDMLEDLWPRFCGPKMQHYLRHGLLTLLRQREPQTILELVRLLTDDRFRDTYTRDLTDPMLAAFWRNEWPAPRERERDASIKAVLNKLGAFVAYDSIRSVVGQGLSTIRPRVLMDAGGILVVDLSRVGGDNASLFGAMLISRYYIDAVGRQGTPRASRRPHLLVVDEAQRFDTRGLGRIEVEGRKFGLILALASQSLAGLGERLRSTILTNTASLVLLAPGAEDVRSVGRLFAPLQPERLSDLARFEFVLRTPGPDGTPTVYGGRVVPPEPGDPAVAEEVTKASDARDARTFEDVRAEVHRRAGGDVAAGQEVKPLIRDGVFSARGDEP